MKNSLFILLGLILITACKKTNDKLIIGSWKVEKVEYSSDGINFEADLDNCVNDDIWTFNKDNTLDINQGLTCAGNPYPNITWSLKDNNQTIAYVYEGVPGEYYSEIVEMDKKTLITELFTNNIENGKIRNTFSKY